MLIVSKIAYASYEIVYTSFKILYSGMFTKDIYNVI